LKASNQKNGVLVFDLDNTLILRDEAMVKCIEAVFSIPLSTLEKRKISEKDQKGYADRMDFCNWLQEFLEIPMEAIEVWALIRKNIGRFVRLNNDVTLVLNKISKHFDLALLSNGGRITQSLKIKSTGLDQYFAPQSIFISEAIGWKKPEPNAFKIVEQSFPSNAKFCMIGDNWQNDIVGALNVGWQAIHVSLDKEPLKIKEIQKLNSFSQLEGILNKYFL